ncbi:MAG: hypothetical protein A2156_13685 [Deltaproteobacteria bacterium RBG_16_48_10]|nr:MAG: hypothetical protein A2156_13685 [Deltaproteobacteria bacterium RBG_16_48_10]
MECLPIREPFGSLVIGSIGEGNGPGFWVIGRGLRDPMRFGFPGTGKKDHGVGSGSKDTGNIDSKKFGVMSWEFGVKIKAPNTELRTVFQVEKCLVWVCRKF